MESEDQMSTKTRRPGGAESGRCGPSALPVVRRAAAGREVWTAPA